MTFLEQFEKYKDSQGIALVCGETSLSYARLYKRCSALARILRSRGVGVCSTTPEDYDLFDPTAAKHSPWVVIVSARTENAVIGAIAAWMAGGAFVLVGSDAPEAYIGCIAETAAAVVLRDTDFTGLDADTGFGYNYPRPDELACAVFTSGSTGRPKGAALEHRVFDEMLRWQTEYMKPGGFSATAAYAPFGFIAAIWEMFFPLANGLALHILEDSVRHDLFALAKYIEENDIAYMFLPPNIAEIFTGIYEGKALKYLRVAGGRLKACSPNGYEILYSLGMAENGGSVTFKPIRSAMSGDIPIGRPWNRTRVRLDADTGEMVVSGPSLFRGYLGMRDETERRLRGGEYYSGDLAQADGNGELVHKGRADFTVKIRDMKVNPAQVETALGECAGVNECCVTSQTQNGESVLIGWFAGSAEEPALRSELSARLPEHMIPSVFVAVEKLPRNLNGKVDKNGLIYTPPKTTTGTTVGITGMFERILGCRAEEDDSFFALGGDSLKLMRLQAEIARELSRSVPYTELFKNPTPRGITGLLQHTSSLEHIPPAEPSEFYPLSEPMRQMWLLWRTGQDGGRYTVSVRCGFAGEIDRPRTIAAFKELTRRSAILRSRFIERGGDVFQVIEDSIEVTLSDNPRREFDLSLAPIFDITLGKNTLCFTTHHIIADAMGLRNIIEDFWTLYGGGTTPEAVQAHDLTMWALGKNFSVNEGYWRKMFSDYKPAPALPMDFPRPSRLSSAARQSVSFDAGESTKLREYATSHGATVFQGFLAAYALLLSRLCGADVTVGVPFSGREHPDTQRVIGMLVKTLPLRLDVCGMDLDAALPHTRERFAGAWEHQGISLERLMELIPRTMSGNAFYDVMINYIPLPRPLPDTCGLRPELIPSEYPLALFDLILEIHEKADGFAAVFVYADELFSAQTVRNWADAFKKLLLTGEADIEAAPAHSHGTVLAATDEALPQELAEAWKAVLGTDTALPHDDFFALGGTSLMAIRLEAALFEKGWLLSAADIFQNPKLCEMAALMSPADDIDWEADM